MSIFSRKKKTVAPTLSTLAGLGAYANSLSVQRIQQMSATTSISPITSTGTGPLNSGGGAYQPGPSTYPFYPNQPYFETTEPIADIKQIDGKESKIIFFDKILSVEQRHLYKLKNIAISILTNSELNMHRFWYAGKFRLSTTKKESVSSIIFPWLSNIPLVCFNHIVFKNNDGGVSIRDFPDSKSLMNAFLHAPKFMEFYDNNVNFELVKDAKIECLLELDLDMLEKPVDILCAVSIEMERCVIVA